MQKIAFEMKKYPDKPSKKRIQHETCDNKQK